MLSGNPSLWGLFRLASTCRMYAMHTPVDSSGRCFLEYDKLTDEHFTFFASSQASIARCLYEPDFPNHPLEVGGLTFNISLPLQCITNIYDILLCMLQT